MKEKISVFLFRQDLRLSDNPGLYEAARKGSVMPVYILDEKRAGKFKMGSASRWWLHHSLLGLNNSLDNKLNLYIGDTKSILLKIFQEYEIEGVYWNRCYEPWRIQDDTEIKAFIREKGITCKTFKASLLWEPWEALKNDGTAYKVYTPFYRNCCLKPPLFCSNLPKPENLVCVKDAHNTVVLTDLKLIDGASWFQKLDKQWTVGENAAQKRLATFLENGLEGYSKDRNYPAQPKTSQLSAHLHFGEISPNQIWQDVQEIKGVDEDKDRFLSELGWREFSYHLLYHFPHLPHKNFQEKFDRFPWQDNAVFLEAWQQGKTGYPIVDAGMRELWATGSMHNRVRMIVASFLVKNLKVHWRHGADWFWDCLVDADLANNSASWQWVAGSGADAAPYFRIFNPILQGEKFDPAGIYTKHFIPELALLPTKYLFKPWQAPDLVLKSSHVILGQTYPKPIVDLETSREEALEAYKTMSKDRDW